MIKVHSDNNNTQKTNNNHTKEAIKSHHSNTNVISIDMGTMMISNRDDFTTSQSLFVESQPLDPQ